MKKFSGFIFAFIMIFASAVLSIGFLPRLVLAENGENEIYLSGENFVETLKNQENYSKTLILTENINFSELMGWNEIYTQLYKFSGVFDGNGYTISNLKILSANNNYGLFSRAENAVIKNLKIDGKVAFSLSSSLSYNIGALVGSGINVNIENCYLSDDVIFTTNLESDKLEISGSCNIGGFIGWGEECSVYNSVANLSIKTNSISNFASINNIGGVIGVQGGGKVDKTVSSAKIEFAPASDDENFYVGGITGEISGRYASVRDSIFYGSIVGNSEACGGIVGNISKTNSVANGNIDFAYWTDKYIEKAIGEKNSYLATGTDKLRNVEFINIDFFAESENWYPLSNGWDFALTYFMRESRPRLQMFESFSFSLSSITSEILESVSFLNETGEDGSAIVKFGEEVKVELKIKEEFAGYYEISYLSLNNALTTRYSANAKYNESGKINGYTVTIPSSDLTDGVYSFEFKTIRFNCEAVVSDASQGGVKERNGQVTSDKLQLTLSYDSLPITVVAEGKGIYNFTHWELYFLDENNEWQLSPDQTQFDYNSSNMEIRFGRAPFDKEFRLKAYFSDQNAISVKFTSTGATDGIKSIHFSGIEYKGEDIRVSSTARTVVLKVVLDKGYQLDTKAFEAFIKRYYGSASTASIIRNVDEGEEQSSYEMSINMAIINDNISEKNLTLTFFIKEVSGAEAQNLLWLYITIPVVVVVGVGVILLIIFLRKKGATKRIKKKKEEEEENDYKNYYI